MFRFADYTNPSNLSLLLPHSPYVTVSGNDNDSLAKNIGIPYPQVALCTMVNGVQSIHANKNNNTNALLYPTMSPLAGDGSVIVMYPMSTMYVEQAPSPVEWQQQQQYPPQQSQQGTCMIVSDASGLLQSDRDMWTGKEPFVAAAVGRGASNVDIRNRELEGVMRMPFVTAKHDSSNSNESSELSRDIEIAAALLASLSSRGEPDEHEDGGINLSAEGNTPPIPICHSHLSKHDVTLGHQTRHWDPPATADANSHSLAIAPLPLVATCNDDKCDDPHCSGNDHYNTSPFVARTNCSKSQSEAGMNKTFECDECGQRYHSEKGLKRHQRVHNPSTRGCPYCNKKFARKSYLHDHIRIHTGEKPFQCSLCHKRFACKRNLNQHSRTHSDEKRYCCQWCGRKFRVNQSLKFHLSKVHS